MTLFQIYPFTIFVVFGLCSTDVSLITVNVILYLHLLRGFIFQDNFCSAPEYTFPQNWVLCRADLL